MKSLNFDPVDTLPTRHKLDVLFENRALLGNLPFFVALLCADLVDYQLPIKTFTTLRRDFSTASSNHPFCGFIWKNLTVVCPHWLRFPTSSFITNQIGTWGQFEYIVETNKVVKCTLLWTLTHNQLLFSIFSHSVPLLLSSIIYWNSKIIANQKINLLNESLGISYERH